MYYIIIFSFVTVFVCLVAFKLIEITLCSVSLPKSLFVLNLWSEAIHVHMERTGVRVGSYRYSGQCVRFTP